MQPSSSDVHVNAPLTNILHAYYQKDDEFIFDKVFPMVPVKKQGDIYLMYTKKQWFRSDMQKRAPGTESAGTGWDIDKTRSYYCDVWALHKDLSNQEKANQDDPINLDEHATIFVGRQARLRAEKEFVNKYFKTGIWTGSTSGADITPGVLWSAANSTPVKDVKAQMRACRIKTGRKPNTLVVSGAVHDILSEHPDIVDKVKYTQTGIVTEELLAAAFGVKKYLVAEVSEDTAQEGVAESMAALYGKHAMLCYSADMPSILEPSAGYIFRWTGLIGGGKFGATISKWYNQNTKCDRVEIEEAWDMKQIAADLGVFFASVIA